VIELIDTYWLYFLVGQYPHGPLGGLALTLILAVLGLLFAFPLGLVFGIARVSPWRSVRWPVSTLIQVVRGTPLLMVVFWAYFFLPSLTGQNTNQFWTMLTALVVFDAAYLAEIIRAGIQGIGKGADGKRTLARLQLSGRDAAGDPAASGTQHAAPHWSTSLLRRSRKPPSATSSD
jgi:polar amino acid transport system permease protein